MTKLLDTVDTIVFEKKLSNQNELDQNQSNFLISTENIRKFKLNI